MQIIYAIMLALTSILGPGNHQAKALEIYNNGSYEIEGGIVIIDTDEL